MTLHRTVTGLIGVALGLGISLSASAQDSVLQSVSVKVHPGQMDEYMARVGKLQAVMTRVGAGGNAEAWLVTTGGPATGTTFVALEYPSLTAYAEGTTKAAGDAEFQKVMAGLDDIRTLQSASLYRQIAGPARSGDIPTGSILQTVSLKVKPGHLDDYLAKVASLQKVSERHGGSGTMRIWQATVAGEATGTVVVGVLYKDLATYAEQTAKIQGDAEWQKLVAGLDGIRTLQGSALSRNVGP